MANIVGLNTPQIDIGQLGSAYLADNAAFKPPVGKVVVAVLSLDDATKFTALTPSNGEHAYAGTVTVADANGTNADVIPNTETFPKGVTLYGRWTGIELAAGAVIIYFGQ